MKININAVKDLKLFSLLSKAAV